ncbi:MAG: TetR/AcrR family transcriptional regulator [Tuberibacillus sp.]
MPKVSQEHLNKRRLDILEAAKRVFLRKGFEPTTMKDVVEESGMSRGGVYQYFSSTEEMLEALHEEQTDRFGEYLTHLLNEHPTVWDALNEYLLGYEVAERDVHPIPFGIVMYEYSVTSWRNERHRQFMLTHSSRSAQNLIRFLQEGVNRGEFRPIQPLKTIAYFIFNVTDGLILHSTIANLDIGTLNGQVEALRIYLKKVLGVV